MRAIASVLAASLLLGACNHDQGAAEPVVEATVPEPPAPQEPPAPTPDPAEPTAASVPDDPAEVIRLDTTATEPPRPVWWFDGDHWHERMLKVCLEAMGDDMGQARERLTAALMERIHAEFGQAPVDLGVTQDIAILPDGRVRLAAMFEIQPRADALDAEGPDGDE